MHLIFLARGIISQLNVFEMFMQTQMFKWERKNLKTGEIEVVQVQGALRRLPFGYEYIFPEECLDEVLTMLDARNCLVRWNLGKLRTTILRLIFGKSEDGDRVKPIPEYKDVLTNRFIETRGVAIYLIGIKKDKRMAWETAGYEQEML